MIGLVETNGHDHALHGLSSIQYVARTEARAAYYRVHHDGGGTPSRLMPMEYFDLKVRPVQIMPAEPGMKLVIVYPPRGEDAGFADALPIIAWALCVDGMVRPVLPSGVRRGYNPDSTCDWHPDYVLLPDGSLYELGYEADHDRYENIEAVVAHETSRALRYERERLERAAARTEVSA